MNRLEKANVSFKEEDIDALLHEYDVSITSEQKFRSEILFLSSGVEDLCDFIDENSSCECLYCYDKDIFEEFFTTNSTPIDLGHIILSVTLFPVVINLISNYIYDKLNKTKKDKLLNIIISIADKKRLKCKTIEFTGTAEEFNKIAKDLTKFVKSLKL